MFILYMGNFVLYTFIVSIYCYMHIRAIYVWPYTICVRLLSQLLMYYEVYNAMVII